MPSPKSVSQIKSLLLSPALTSHFEVELGIPEDLRTLLGIQQEKLNLMCSEASLPGSQLTTLELTNDRTGVTEKHAYRRMFDDRLDLTFYVDAKDYVPIKFFETWISFIMNEDSGKTRNKNYSYRVKYPDDYISDQGLIVRKFERDYEGLLEYEFIRSFPLAVNSMPVSYDASNLLKCTVSMSYIRYIVNGIQAPVTAMPASLRDRFTNPNPDFAIAFDSNMPAIFGTETFPTYDKNFGADAFSPQGQANFNTAINSGILFGQPPVSEQVTAPSPTTHSRAPLQPRPQRRQQQQPEPARRPLTAAERAPDSTAKLNQRDRNVYGNTVPAGSFGITRTRPASSPTVGLPGFND